LWTRRLPFPQKQKSSNETAIKTAIRQKQKWQPDLAASHLIDFWVFLAPQVGLEPTTLRLTAECSAIFLVKIA
jgi:hypothetical protein